MKLEEIRSLGGEVLGYSLPKSLVTVQKHSELLKGIVPNYLDELGKIHQVLVPLKSLGGKELGYLFPPEMEKIQRIVKQLENYFPNRDLTISLDDLLEVPINGSETEPLNEQEQAIVSEIISGKEPSPSSLSNKVSIRKILHHIYFFLQLYINMQFYLQGVGVDISPKYIYENFTSPRSAIEQVLAICDKYPTNGRSYGARIIQSKNGLNLRKYDHQRSEILAKLPNGKFLCVLKEPLDNAQWLLVATELDNGEVIKGYVARKFTRQLN